MSEGLVLDGATYTYAGTSRPAVRNVSLTLAPGRIVGVVGANESGKSTLCLVASGLAPAAVGGRLGGSVRLDGDETTALRADALAQCCGVLFQNPAAQLSHASATVFEEVAFGPCNLALPAREVVERVRWAMATVGVEELAPRDPLRLSGGQSQLVALASVLALRPRYLILDEPTSELDPAGTRLVVEALGRVVEETGTGILLVEHKSDVVAAMAGEVVVLAGGSVALSGETGAVLANPRIPELGVEPPAAVRLERAVRSSGVEWTARLAEAVL